MGRGWGESQRAVTAAATVRMEDLLVPMPCWNTGPGSLAVKIDA